MRHATQRTKLWFFAVMLIGIAAIFLCAFSLVKPAFADNEEIYAAETAAQQQVEESAVAYDEAVAALESIEREIAANEARIVELSAQIPVQQEKSDQAIRYLYTLQQEGGSVFMMLFTSGSLSEFFNNLEYITAIYNDKMASVTQLKDMKAELDEIAASLDAKRILAAQEAVAAQKALEEAQALREAAQAAAEAARQAEAEAAAAAAAAAAEEEARREAEEEARRQAEEAAAERQEGDLTSGEVTASPGSDGADWSTDKETFVAEWGPRIDSYMGSAPLAGYGATFAAAAWDYGIDPRFSAAISCVESSKGLYCFRNHNAWGWGSVDWDTWEEAIYAHARGLSRGYGYTVSVSGAQKYCPPNWEFWYSRVCAEMAKI